MQPVNTKAIAKKQSEVNNAIKKFLAATGNLPVSSEVKASIISLLTEQESEIRKAITDAGLIATLPVDESF